MRAMKIYVWEDLESVEYVSKKEDVYGENGNIVTKETIFPKTAPKKSNGLTETNKSFSDALNGVYPELFIVA